MRLRFLAPTRTKISIRWAPYQKNGNSKFAMIFVFSANYLYMEFLNPRGLVVRVYEYRVRLYRYHYSNEIKLLNVLSHLINGVINCLPPTKVRSAY